MDNNNDFPNFDALSDEDKKKVMDAITKFNNRKKGDDDDDEPTLIKQMYKKDD